VSILRTFGVAAENSDPHFIIRAWYRNTTGHVVLYDSTTGSSPIGEVSRCDLVSTVDLDTLTISYNMQNGTIDPTGTLWPYYGQSARIAPGCLVAICPAENTVDDNSKEWLPFFGYVYSVSSDTIVCRSVKSTLNTMYWLPSNLYISPTGSIGGDPWFQNPLYWWFHSTVPMTDPLGQTIKGNPGSGWQIQSGKLGALLPGVSDFSLNYPATDDFSTGDMNFAAARAVLATEKPSAEVLNNFSWGSLAQVSFGAFLNTMPPASTSGVDYLTPMRILYTARRTAEDKTFGVRWRLWPALGYASTAYGGLYRIMPTNSACGVADPANYNTWGTSVTLNTSFQHYIEVEDSDVSLDSFEPGAGARTILGQSYVDWFTQTTRYSPSVSVDSAGAGTVEVSSAADEARFVLSHPYSATALSFSDIMPLTTKLGYFGRVLWNTNDNGLDQVTYPTSKTPMATGGWDNLGVAPCVPEFDVGSMTEGTSNLTYVQPASDITGDEKTVSRANHQNQLDLINLIQADNTKWRVDSGSPYGGDSDYAQLVTQTINRMSVNTQYEGFQFAFTQAGRAMGVWCRKMATFIPQTDYMPSLEITQNNCDLLTGTGTLTLGVPSLYSGDKDWAPSYYRSTTKFLTKENEKTNVWKTYT